MRSAHAGLAVMAMIASCRAASVCYSDEEDKAHTTGEVCASIWNAYDTTGYIRLRESGRCDTCGQCAPTGPLQYAPSRGQGWAQISSAYGCQSNREGISMLQNGRIVMDLEATINDCLKACEEHEECLAVDFRCSINAKDQICVLFDSACEDPLTKEDWNYGAASYRIVPNGEDTHSRPLSISKKEPEKLEVRVVDGLCGDAEYKSLEYCGEHKTYVVHGEKDTVRLEVARDDEEWKKSACWKMRDSEFLNGWFSFESKLKPDDKETEKNDGYYLRLNGAKAQVSKYSSNDNWKKQASWHLRYPVTEKALCEAHTDVAGFPNCVWSDDLPRLPAGTEPAPDAEPVGFYWGEEGDAANGDVKTFSVGQHSFSPFEAPTFANPDTQVEGVNVEFEEGYEEGHDHLHINPEYAAQQGLSVTWDKSSGSLRLRMAEAGKTKSAKEWAQVIAQVHFETESTELHHRRIVWNFGDDSFYADETQHFYKEIKRTKPVTWAEARDDCKSRMLLGETGYLVTITSQVEQDIVKDRLHASGWIGACDGPGTADKCLGGLCTSDSETGCEDWEGGQDECGKEGEWRWCEGPESMSNDPADEKQGLMFWKGTGNSGVGPWPTSTTDFETEEVTLGHGYDAMFSNWSPNQPDNWRSNEDCAQIKPNGEWNDIDCKTNRVKSYICEWNGGGSLREAHGSVTVKVKACLSKPCNYQNEKDCQRDPRESNPRTADGPGGCTWYPSEGAGLGACYPKCENEYYGALCDRHCNNKDTCNNHGRCDKEGYCKCNNGWMGPNCDWECTKCTAWGDPHHTNFAGVKFDNHGVDKQFLLFSRPSTCPAGGTQTKECHDFVLYANNYRCSGTEKNPIGCMDQVTLRDVVNGWALQLEVEDRNTAETEHGKIWITETTGGTPKEVEASSLTIPHIFADDTLPQDQQLKRKPVVLLEAKRHSAKKFSWIFELPGNGQMHTKIEIQQDNSWKAPYMNVWVHHCGPLCATQPDASGNSAEVSCVQGLCNGDCGDQGKWRTGVSKDCTDAFKQGDFDCPGPHATPEECGQPHHPVAPKPECTRDEKEGAPTGLTVDTWCICDPNNQVDADVMQITSEALAWADESCCSVYKSCGETDKSKTGNYDACMIEHCNMAWMGSKTMSVCLPSVQEAILKQGQCASVVCPDGFEGEKCERCQQDRFGADCSKKCDAATKCNGHGQCSGEGECQCQEGWDFSEEVEGEMKYCLHECRKLSREQCAEGTPRSSCQFLANGKCEKKCDKDYYGEDCSVKCSAVETCNEHGHCDAKGKCVCDKGYEGEGCTESGRECTVSGRLHVASFPETQQAPAELSTTDELVELFRTPGVVKQPSTNGGPTLRDQYGVTAMTYACGKSSRCIRRIAVYSGMALQSVEIRSDGTFVKATGCQGATNKGECPDVCGTLECSAVCGAAQDIDKMKAQGYFDTGAHNIAGFGDRGGKVLKITNVDKKKDGTLAFTLEIPDVVKVKVVTGVDNGKSMDISIEQSVMTGLQDYAGVCAAKSVPAIKTWFCPDAEPMPPPTESCKDTEVKLRVSACCDKYKGCGGNDAVYEECAEDECTLGAGTECLPSFFKRAAEKGCACWPAHNVVWDPIGGEDEMGGCTACADGYYGEKCDVFCSAKETCSEHGKCNGKGGCDCDEGWEDLVEAGGMTRACAVEKGCAEGGAAGWKVLDPEWACTDAYGEVAANKEKVKPVTVPVKQSTLSDCKKVCEADPKCIQIDWYPELQRCGMYYQPATDCQANTFAYELERVTPGESYGLTRAAAKVCPPPAEPKCFKADKSHAEPAAGGATTFTITGVGAAPCTSPPCKDGQVAGITKGKACAAATQADVLFLVDAYYNANAPKVRTASESKGKAKGEYELCYIPSKACGAAWQPVLKECTRQHFSPPACTACETGYGPEGSCNVQCTREGTCSGHGTCDFTNPSSPCRCDETRDYKYVDQGGERCVQRKSKVPSPPPACGQEDCSGRAETVTGSVPDCSCTCRNKWEGPSCSVCPPGFDEQADCKRCKEGRAGEKCEITCDKDAMCGANGASVLAGADGCTCKCKGNWQFKAGEGCTVCPAVFDKASGCTECADKSASPPACASTCSLADHCVAANTASVELKDGECKCMCKAQWTGEKCQDCPAQFSGQTAGAPMACDKCATGMAGSPPQCKACTVEGDCFGNAVKVSVSAGGQCDCQCKNAWQTNPTTGVPCSMCPENFDMEESDCSECIRGYELSTDGKSCKKSAPKPCSNQLDCNGNAKQEPTGDVGSCKCECRNFWSGKDCSECDRTRYGGADCDQCPEGFTGTPATGCTECSTAAVCPTNGRAASVVDGVCRCTCQNFWSGADCNTCPSLYNKDTGCSQCATGVPPLCGQDTCSAELHCNGNAVSASLATVWAADFPISECKCECRNEWGGNTCNECPATVGGPDCNVCAKGYYGSTPSDCKPCSGFCKNFPLSHDSEDGKCQCVCSGKWEGEQCDKCPANMDDSCEVCVEGFSWDKLEGACVQKPGTQPGGLIAEVGNLPCTEKDCVVHKGDKVKAKISGTDGSAAPGSSCQSERCPAGTARIVPKGAPCNEGETLKEVGLYTTAKNPEDRVSDEFEANFGDTFRVCFKEEGASSFTPVPRACPVNFERGADGECSQCMAGWYGSDCRIFCSADYTCHGHGRCTPSVGTCECDDGWQHTAEEEGFEKHSSQQCFSSTTGKEETSPFFVPITGDAKPSDDGDKVEITLTGTGPAPKDCSNPKDGCADGTVVLVKDTPSASCSSPKESDVLGQFPMKTTESGEQRVTDGEVPVTFDAKDTKYIICYQPDSDMAPVPAQVPNVRGAAPVPPPAGDNGSGANTALIAALAVIAALSLGALVAVCARHAAKVKQAKRRADAQENLQKNTTDFSTGNLRQEYDGLQDTDV